jgi:hypothetical protein
MATVIHSQKALAVNPLKVSQPMGAQPVEQTLKRIARQENLEIRSFGACRVKEPRPHRGADVAELTRHRTPLLRGKGA